jgi:hypothetical protein
VRFDCGRVVSGHRQNHLVKEYKTCMPPAPI